MSEQKKIQIPKPVMVDPKILKLHPKNIKRHDEKQLHDLGVLYEMIGFTDPIIADKKNLVWAGNGSLLEALENQIVLNYGENQFLNVMIILAKIAMLEVKKDLE